VLFIAHREEILSQALDTYRKIAPEARLGRYTGAEKAPAADAGFASIQTLCRDPNLTRFEPDDFDYIVMDEFHHACAPTYRKVLDHFEPEFVLGLAATPERTNCGDLLGLCQHNLVYRCDLVDGIRRGLLCPFRYWEDELVRGFRKAARRSATLRADVSASLEDDGALRSLVENNTVEAWVGGRGTGGEAYFSYEGGVFSTEFGVEEEHRETLVEMTREIVDWRLGEYMQRSSVAGEEPVSFVCDVGHDGRQGVLELPDRRVVAGIPFGDVEVVFDGEVDEARFGNEVVDAGRREGEYENRLDGLLERWFGGDWAEAGRTLRVRVEASEDGYRLEGLD